MKIFLIFIASLLFGSGCASNLYLKESDKSKSSQQSKQIVYVTNKDHPNYKALEKSEIYEISENPDSEKKLTLEESQVYFRCGNPMLGAIITFGIIPGYLDADEAFQYSMSEDGKVTEYKHELKMYERISLWEWFAKPFKWSETSTKAKALAHSKKESVIN